MNFPPLTKRDLLEHFDAKTYSRGFAYYNQKKVLKFDIYEDGEGAWFVRSKVKGTYVYSQHIDISYAGNRLYLETECDCPVEYRCKHCAAALFQMLNMKHTGHFADLPTQWLDTFLKADRPQVPHLPDNPTESFLILRLFRSINSDFDFCKAKILKNGTVSKGTKISEENMFYYYGRSYQYDYLTEEDRKLIEKLIPTKKGDYYGTQYRFYGEYGALMLKEIAKSGKGYFRDNTTPLSYDPTPKPLEFQWQKEEEMYRIVSNLEEGEVVVTATIPPMCINTRTNRLYEIKTEYGTEKLACMLDAPVMPEDAVLKITQQIMEKEQDVHFPIPDVMHFEEIKTDPEPSLYLYVKSEGGVILPVMELHFFYATHEFNVYPFRREERIVNKKKIYTIVRNEEKERTCRDSLESYGFVYSELLKGYGEASEMGRQESIERWRIFMEEVIPVLKEHGWSIEIDENFNYSFEYADAVVVNSEEEGGVNPWFELSFNVEFGGRSIALLPIVSSLLQQYDSVEELPPKLNLEFEEGRFLHIASEEIMPILRTVFELFDKQKGDILQVKPYDAHLISLDEESSIVWKGSNELRELAKKLRSFEGIELKTPASSLNATLRDYQLFGLSWLSFLHMFRFGGILADDMGLGKTVQTLAFLDLLKSTNRLEGPTLIIMPTSLIGNWKNEIEKFTPNLRYLQLYGPERDQLFEKIEAYDIILTTYQLAQRDAEKYQKEQFFYIILDEAQKIKNPTTKMAVAIKSFNASYRLALSGTPIENHLGELWSIFDFVMPGFLDNLKFFRTFYQFPIEKEHDMGRKELLNKKVAPFILRRTKEEVALELPSKTEIIKRAIFDKKQATLYENIRITMEKKVRDTIKEKGLSKSHITILDALLKLRQVCCHPSLLKLESAKSIKHSAKLELFLELMDELMSEGRKVLVFSQFTSMLSILESEIKKRKYSYSKLTGATRKRDEVIQKFTQGKADIFLISLKAGGVGLNLVEADTVIHYDPWWNPAVENQATDRAYRIGQNKPVFVYKLIVENTIEEQILKLQEKKRQLQNGIYREGENKEEHFSGEELVELLRI
jgi:SNF2 family DNA or RNA helicase